jgi:hypothetical protein
MSVGVVLNSQVSGTDAVMGLGEKCPQKGAKFGIALTL